MSFYPGAERRVLDGLNLRIRPRERIALIGENGQATTIVKLLTRLTILRPAESCWMAWTSETTELKTCTVRSA